MHIAVYHPWIKSKGGVERLLFEYSSLSSHKIDLLTHHYSGSFEEYSIFPKVLGDGQLKEGFISRGLQVGAKIATTKIEESRYDALIVSESGLGSLITLRNHSLPLLCYCHTPLRAAHTFYRYYLDQYGFWKKQAFRLGTAVYRKLEKRAWSYFDKIICNSKNTCRNTKNAELASNTKREVIYPGSHTKKFSKGKKGDYFFYPSRFKRYKRQDLAITALEQFNQISDKNFKLILAGQPEDKEYLDELKRMADKNIEFKLSPTDTEMSALYSNCFSVLFTAYNEDWGIIPIEAMAAGKPVIAVNEGGPTESILDGETGYLADSNPAEIAKKMLHLVKNSDLYRKMSERSLSRAQEFTWEGFASHLDKEVEKLV